MAKAKATTNSYAPQFRANADSEWDGCEERYATEEEAMGQAKVLAAAADALGIDAEFRAAPSEDPVNAKFDLTQTA